MKLVVVGLLLSLGQFANASSAVKSFNCSLMSGGTKPEVINTVVVKASRVSTARLVAAIQSLEIVDESGTLASKDQANAPMA